MVLNGERICGFAAKQCVIRQTSTKPNLKVFNMLFGYTIQVCVSYANNGISL